MPSTGPSLAPRPLTDPKLLQFEVIEGRDLLRYTLAAAVDACVDGWRFSHSLLGIIPRNSVVDKFPYYRCVLRQQHVVFEVP